MPKNNYNIKYIIPIVFFPLALFFVFHDFMSYPKSLYPIFEQAGSNQSELKNVIKHYSHHASDSLKLKAAIFLIENMDAHYSYQSDQWEKFQLELDSLFKKETDPVKLDPLFDSIYKKYDFSDARYISDLQTVKAKFLIRNIDEAFKAWQSPYANHLSFDDFCEYILPYRVSQEPLGDWRKEFNQHFIPDMFSRIRAKKNPPPTPVPIPYRTCEEPYGNWVKEFNNNINLNPWAAIEKNYSVTARDICDALKTSPGSLRFMPGQMLDFNTHLLSVLISGTCRDYSFQAALAARTLGVPVTIDFTPQWATRSTSHEWNVLIEKNTKPLSFGFGDYVELGKHIEIAPDRIPAKVYRKTFAKQATSLAQICGKEEIPSAFLSPCMKDVTNDYYQTIDVPVKLLSNPPEQNKFAYLSVFNDRKWVPVAWIKINKSDVLFKNLNKNIVCLPSYYYQDEVIPAAYPVILRTDGTITTLKPNLQSRKTVVLNRKYQARMSAWLGPSMIGGRFQVSNDSNFTKTVDIYEKKDIAEPYFQIVNIHLKGKYKYFRYIHPHGDVAEIEICEPGSLARLTGRAIGNCQPLPGSQYANAFDGDVLTQFLTDDAREDTWVGLVFDKPRRIGRIAYLRRNDGNCICNGELYELFYWDNKWISLGQQIGSNKTYRLTYHNVPTNALMLLRDITKGHEDRIFTYENGEQVWW
jgi:hypothetical protein